MLALGNTQCRFFFLGHRQTPARVILLFIQITDLFHPLAAGGRIKEKLLPGTGMRRFLNPSSSKVSPEIILVFPDDMEYQPIIDLRKFLLRIIINNPINKVSLAYNGTTGLPPGFPRLARSPRTAGTHLDLPAGHIRIDQFVGQKRSRRRRITANDYPFPSPEDSPAPGCISLIRISWMRRR